MMVKTRPSYTPAFGRQMVELMHAGHRRGGAGPKDRSQDSVSKALLAHRVAAPSAARYSFRAYEWRGYVPTFKAIVVEKSDGGQTVRLTDFDEANLMDGDVTVRVEWSTVNYKDGLAITGKAPVVRRFPMIAGIDFAGTVESSTHPQWKPGDSVILNGWGLGETHLGGYAEKARVKGNWLVRLPARNSARGAMAIGTAGFTA